MVEKVLDRAKRKVDAAEVFFIDKESEEISFEAGKLKSAEKKSISGIALRVIHEGHVGFSSTTDPARIDDMIEHARFGSRFGKEAKFVFPGAAEIVGVNTFDPAVEAYTAAEAVKEGRIAVDELLLKCPKGLTDVSITRSVTTTHIANTSGLDMSYRSTDFIESVTLTIVEGDSILWIGDGGHYGTLDIRTQGYIAKIADLAGKASTNAPKVSGKIPVIFAAQELPNLINSIELGVNGMRLVKGDSPLIGREGEKMLGDITLTEDPFIPGAPGSRPFDDEGVPSRRNVIFDNGTFGAFLFDNDTAGDAGKTSTASAHRGMLSLPEIGLSNLVVSPGDSTLAEMTAGIKEGIIVHGVLGGGQSNVLAGDFSLNVMLGFLIRDGEYAGRLTDTMVSGNVYEAFNTVSAMNSQTTQVGLLFVPDVLFSALDVSG